VISCDVGALLKPQPDGYRAMNDLEAIKVIVEV
jgi:hypothetical protein